MALSNRQPGPQRAFSLRLLRLRLRRRLPLLIWIGVFILTAALYFRQESGLTVTAFAQERRFQVAPEETGRLQHLVVDLNQEVTRGQIVAALNADKLALKLQEARAELERITHEIGRERALWESDTVGLQVDQITNLRRFARDVSNAHVAYLAALADLAENRINLQGLELTLDRTRQLEASDMTSTAALQDDQIAFEALGRKVAGQTTTVAAMLQEYQAAETRYRDFLETRHVDPSDATLRLKPLESALKVQETRIELVNLALANCVLRAPADGRVVEIFRCPGEIVASGQSVLTILDPRATGLVAYLPEPRIHDLAPGAEVRIRRVSGPGRTYLSAVACLGSSVEQLPLRQTPEGTVPGWGLSVYIPLPGSLTATPGEAFEVICP